jgi:uncharacterized protein YjiS (DUF1127 family)
MTTQTHVNGSVSGLAAGRSQVSDFFRSTLALPAKVLERAFDRLATWQQRAYERRQLRMLDDHMLHDVGLSRADVESEARKPFWLS